MVVISDNTPVTVKVPEEKNSPHLGKDHKSIQHATLDIKGAPFLNFFFANLSQNSHFSIIEVFFLLLLLNLIS